MDLVVRPPPGNSGMLGCHFTPCALPPDHVMKVGERMEVRETGEGAEPRDLGRRCACRDGRG